jgi:photosystem II stability/assembly factor-like uncharacterized protein
MLQFKSSFTLFIVLVVTLFLNADQELSESAKAAIYASFCETFHSPHATVAEKRAAFDHMVANRAFPVGREAPEETGPVQMLRYFDYAESRVGEDGKLRAFNYWEAKEYIDANMAVNTSVIWEEIGPDSWGNIAGHWNPGIGRFNGVCEDPNNENVIYLSTPAGGVWKSEDAGQAWRNITDALPAIGATSVAVDYNNSDIVYLGSGDGDACNVNSIGVLKSTDGGETWNLTGLTFELSGRYEIHKVMISPKNSSVLFAATNDGLYRTTDAGENWEQIRDGNSDDVEFKPGDTQIVYAMISNRFYRSTNGGSSFSQVTSGLPSSAGRSLIGVTPANPDYVYILSSKTSGSFQGVYRSSNSGTSFELRGDQPSGIYGYNTDGSSSSHQTNYDLAFTVSPIDAEEVHLGNILTWRSTDGGRNWRATTAWRYPVSSSYEYTHCDIHALEYFGDRLYVGSDGLVCRSTNEGSDFEDIVNGQIGVRQFYKIAVAQGGNVTKIVGGSQDNGTCYYDGTQWYDWMGADGMDCMVSPDGRTMYGTTQGGNWTKRIDDGNVSMRQPGGGAWVTPAIIHPDDPDILFVGNDKVSKSTNGGDSWTSIGLNDGRDKKAITLCKTDPDYIYVTRSSYVYCTKNGGGSWETVSANGLPSSSITNVAVNPNDPEEVVVTYGGFTSDRKIYRSTNAGDSWENFTKNLPNVPANCAAFDDDGNFYVGMDIGVYILGPGTDKYVRFGTGMPNVIIKDLDIHFTKKMLYAGTYSRGAWVADIANVDNKDLLRPLGPKEIKLLNNYPNPFRLSTTIKFEINKPGKVQLAVYNMLGEKVRTLVDKDLKTGDHNFAWDCKNNRGQKVASGIYIYKIISKDFVDSRHMIMVD